MMVICVKPWPLLIAVTLCAVFCLGILVDAYPARPDSPGDDTSPEEMAKYLANLQYYINLVTRPRYGKRSSPGALMPELIFGDSSSNADHNSRSQYDDSYMW